ncbi:MAG: hypothetical protein R3F55_03105 [Alphaproteobacteria bacterium]
MRTFISRSAMLASASALVMAGGAALAEDMPQAEAAAETEVLVEVGNPGADGVVDPDNVGSAVQALVGREAGDIADMAVYNEAGDLIGHVAMVARNANGGLFLIVGYDEASTLAGVGDQAIPLTRFDYNDEAEALVLWGSHGAAPAMADPYGARARLYSVVAADTVIDAVATDPAVYRWDDAAADEDAVDLSDMAEDVEDAVADLFGNARTLIDGRGVDEIVGLDILDRAGDDIGSVEEIAHNGQGELFLIVSLDDGVLGIGDSERAVSLSAFDYEPERDAFVLLDTSEAALEAMPEWDTDTPGYTVIESDLDWAAFN